MVVSGSGGISNDRRVMKHCQQQHVELCLACIHSAASILCLMVTQLANCVCALHCVALHCCSLDNGLLLSEGQARLIDFIRTAAAEREAAPAGVWANFGKPYACLGELEQVRKQSKLSTVCSILTGHVCNAMQSAAAWVEAAVCQFAKTVATPVLHCSCSAVMHLRWHSSQRSNRI